MRDSSLFSTRSAPAQKSHTKCRTKIRRFAARVNSLQLRAAEGDDEAGEHFSSAKTNSYPRRTNSCCITKKDIQRWRSQQILYTEVCRQPATSADMQGHADVLLVHEKCWTRPRIPSHCFEYKSPQLHLQVGNNRHRARS